MGTSEAKVLALRARLQRWTLRIGVQPRLVRVQPMNRKWGSCSSGGTVTLAHDLARQPSQFQDYVIVHELLHLKVPNHGKLFKALLRLHLPAWRSGRGAGDQPPSWDKRGTIRKNGVHGPRCRI